MEEVSMDQTGNWKRLTEKAYSKSKYKYMYKQSCQYNPDISICTTQFSYPYEEWFDKCYIRKRKN